MNTTEKEKSAENGGKFLDDKSDKEHIKELALLTTFEYDRVRNEKAKELGVQISTLDKAVKEARKDVEISRMNVSPPDPWDKEIQGEALLNEIVFTINRFLKVGKHEATAIALWIMFTYVYANMRICPILLATSSEKRCGKTLLLSLLIKLANKAMPSSNISPSSLFRAIEKWGWTLLIDEADRSLKYNDELLGIINSGHTKDMAYVIRTVGDDHEPKCFSTWGPKAIAGIGRINDTAEDRSIIINMLRKKPGEQVERLRDFDGTEIKRKCIRWAQDNIESLKEHIPDIPDSLHDRAADNWEPLFAIADIVGNDWPKVAREAAESLTDSDIDSDSIKVQLLSDLNTIFEAQRTDKLWTGEILDKLNSMDDRPWPEWKRGRQLTARGLSNLLRPFKVRPKDVKISDTNKKGYTLNDLSDAFSRYLPATPLPPNNDGAFSDFPGATDKPAVADRNSSKPAPDKESSAVADRTPNRGG